MVTGEDGTFSYSSGPLENESGTYKVRVVHPDITDRLVHGTFTVGRLRITPATINLSIPRNYEQTINIAAEALSGSEVNNLHLIFEPLDQPLGILPPGIHLTIGNPITHLFSGTRGELAFTVWADNSASVIEKMILKAVSDERGQENPWAKITINAQFSDAQPVLYFTPTLIETGVSRSDAVTEKVTLKNSGLAPMEDVSVSLLTEGGTTAPAWVALTTGSELGDLAIGESREVSLSFGPDATVTEGIYHFLLRVFAANHPTRDINVYVSVVQSGMGNALFKVADIYTGTLDQNNNSIQGLSSARIQLQNELVLTQEYNLTTDGYGEAYLQGIPSGRYKYRATATNHQEKIGRLWVKPGITSTEEVFLDYNLVTVEWSVTETTISDRYEIVLNVTYETDVPAAVVVVEPGSITLPDMAAGDVFTGELTLTNYGLIRADNVRLVLPSNDANFAYELLTPVPETLLAKQSITVPYRVTCLVPVEGNEADGTGGGCRSYVGCGRIVYEYVCANGRPSWTERGVCCTYTPACSGEGGGSGRGIGVDIRWGGPPGDSESSSSSSTSPPSTPIEGTTCSPPAPPRKECQRDPCGRKSTCKDATQKTGSEVDLLQREYIRNDTDLSVIVPGGTIKVFRSYYDKVWHVGPAYHPLNAPTVGSLVVRRSHGTVTTVIKDGIPYLLPKTDVVRRIVYDPYGNIIREEYSLVNGILYQRDFKMIPLEGGGWRWLEKHGNWKEYDSLGRLISYGTREAVTATMLYEPGEAGNPIGIADRYGRQVIWYRYDESGKVCNSETICRPRQADRRQA